MKIVFSVLILLLFSACNSKNTSTNNEDSVTLISDNIPVERKSINPNAVKTYAETVKSFETTDEFKVALYETNQTFKYLIKISYKQMEVNDTLRIPNFGTQPVVEIMKGDSVKPSCIVGFLDKEKKFRESKLIYFEDNTLKVHVLKYYAVYSTEEPAK